MRVLLRLIRGIPPAAVAVLVLLAGAPGAAGAQQTPAQNPPAAPAQVRDTTRHGVSPRSALFRSLLVPGLGQLSVRAYTRGAIFIALQSTSWYMLIKTLNKVSDAHDSETARVAFATDSLNALIATDSILRKKLQDPIAFQAEVGKNPGVIHARGLLEARKQQRQDWITYTLFFTFASGVDAYVAAQLADFPATIDAEPTSDGGMQFKVNVPFPRK